MRREYVPVNLLEPTNHENDVEHQHQRMPPSTTYAVPETTTTTMQAPTAYTADGEPILMAVAVPNSIRPPKVSHSHAQENPTPITVLSILERISILIVGLALSCLTFTQSFYLILFGSVKASFFEVLMDFIWFGATLCVFVGSFVGAYRGQWRLIVPGLVLQYFVGVLMCFRVRYG